MTVIKCKCCNKSAEDHKMAICGVCKDPYYYQCVDLTISEVRNIKTKKNLNWSCTTCSDLGDNVNDLKSVIVELKKEVEELRRMLSNKPAEDNQNFEEIIAELNDRNERKSNVIIYGIAENGNLRTSLERQNYDKLKVQEVVNFLLPEFNINDIKPFRLGKYDPTKTTSRPIKIKLPSEKCVLDLIKKARNLRNDDVFSSVNISTDRTPRQLQHFRSLKLELNRRRSNGEDNILIKYIKGVPKIVPQLN